MFEIAGYNTIAEIDFSTEDDQVLALVLVRDRKLYLLVAGACACCGLAGEDIREEDVEKVSDLEDLATQLHQEWMKLDDAQMRVEAERDLRAALRDARDHTAPAALTN